MGLMPVPLTSVSGVEGRFGLVDGSFEGSDGG